MSVHIPSDHDIDVLLFRSRLDQMARGSAPRVVFDPEATLGIQASRFSETRAIHTLFERDQAAEDDLLPPHEQKETAHG